MNFLSRVRRWITLLIVIPIVAALSVIVGGAVHAMLAVPDLREWHQFVPQSEATAADFDAGLTFQQYLDREETAFREVTGRLDAAVVARAGLHGSRYDRESASSPSRAERDWNRTFEITPPTLQAGALLVHGLTDSPYSMRSVADRLLARGVYVVSLRMPGHGTVPAALYRATADDWMGAVRMGARHVRQVIGPDRPLLLVGYSNGGALITRYAVESLERADLPAPSGLILISPMIGVSPMARFARVISALGPVPFFEKVRWLDVLPEYNPFKYNSFPANAGQQSYVVSAALQEQLTLAAESGALDRMPPILAFQSVVDATVSTDAVVHQLFDRLKGSQHALVVFDINRSAGLEPYIRPEDAALVARLAAGGARTYHRTLVTNVDPSTLDVKARTVEPGTVEVKDQPLGLRWPPQVFSLSHVALPFKSDDPIYGPDAPTGERPLLSLGRLSPRGEKAVLTVPIDTLMRIGWNPFFSYMADRIDLWVDGRLAPKSAAR